MKMADTEIVEIQTIIITKIKQANARKRKNSSP